MSDTNTAFKFWATVITVRSGEQATLPVTVILPTCTPESAIKHEALLTAGREGQAFFQGCPVRVVGLEWD